MARILVVDDVPNNVKLLADLLRMQGHEVITAGGGVEGLARARNEAPDLLLLDVMMPDLNGYEVCRQLRADPSVAFLPIVLVTALDATEERVKGLEAGADDFIGKPFNRPELMARVRSLLRLKQLHDDLARLNADLESRVAAQVLELERLNALKRFVSPRVRELIVGGEVDNPFTTRRRDISVLFVDLRGFTAFTETAEPEEVMAVLREFHDSLGRIVVARDATVEHFAGDGVMLVLNDPLPVAGHELAAVMLALDIRHAISGLAENWRRQGFDLDFGIGIAAGYATLGAVGFEGRRDYAAIGTVCNLASRLCGEARPGEILISQRVFSRIEGQAVVDAMGELTLKGFHRPVIAYRVLGQV